MAEFIIRQILKGENVFSQAIVYDDGNVRTPPDGYVSYIPKNCDHYGQIIVRSKNKKDLAALALAEADSVGKDLLVLWDGGLIECHGVFNKSYSLRIDVYISKSEQDERNSYQKILEEAT